MLKLLMFICFLMGLILGLMFYVEYQPSYYEMHGYLVVRERTTNLEFFYHWPHKGFTNGTPAGWDLYRAKDKYKLWRASKMYELQEKLK